jgi:hypothetical protein
MARPRCRVMRAMLESKKKSTQQLTFMLHELSSNVMLVKLSSPLYLHDSPDDRRRRRHAAKCVNHLRCATRPL